MASFIGTSNSRELLTDPTGSRRFICVSVERPIRVDGIDHAQVYAQLKAELLAVMRRRCPGVGGEVKMRPLSRSLVAAGVKKVHTAEGNRYLVVQN